MALHLIKLCVGVSEVGELADWARQRRPIVHTRQTPKRAAEILDGGSLYWVIKGQVLVRQAILAVRRQGFAFADQEAELGFRSIAVPVKRYDGVIVAALNLGARIERASPALMRDIFLPRLLKEADELAEQLV